MNMPTFSNLGQEGEKSFSGADEKRYGINISRSGFKNLYTPFLVPNKIAKIISEITIKDISGKKKYYLNGKDLNCATWYFALKDIAMDNIFWETNYIQGYSGTKEFFSLPNISVPEEEKLNGKTSFVDWVMASGKRQEGTNWIYKASDNFPGSNFTTTAQYSILFPIWTQDNKPVSFSNLTDAKKYIEANPTPNGYGVFTDYTRGFVSFLLSLKENIDFNNLSSGDKHPVFAYNPQKGAGRTDRYTMNYPYLNVSLDEFPSDELAEYSVGDSIWNNTPYSQYNVLSKKHPLKDQPEKTMLDVLEGLGVLETLYVLEPQTKKPTEDDVSDDDTAF